MKSQLSEIVKRALNNHLAALEKSLEADVFCFYGEINPSTLPFFRDCIENLKSKSKRTSLAIMLKTTGGNVETVERMVDIVRYNYQQVYFVVPEWAASAGTLFCMSGDKIYMDYFSSLSPIDPQIKKNGSWFSALGYLDKVEELTQKSLCNTISPAEFTILQQFDLSELRQYELAKELGVVLLANWLLKYQIKDWNKHFNTEGEVTEEAKHKRVMNIALTLSNNKHWHSHGRLIGINTLVSSFGLPIEDYSRNNKLNSLIRQCNNLICEFTFERKMELFLHSRAEYS